MERQSVLFPMAGRHLVRLALDGDKVVAEEKLLADGDWRIREVKQAPDGAIYIFAGNQLVRLVLPRVEVSGLTKISFSGLNSPKSIWELASFVSVYNFCFEFLLLALLFKCLRMVRLSSNTTGYVSISKAGSASRSRRKSFGIMLAMATEAVVASSTISPLPDCLGCALMFPGSRYGHVVPLSKWLFADS